ncbi:MAG TPA: discoidin domain-containing protein, partial [Sedimentisphaerales bacterium]|nr:discoidin domain-containing protein [Sedimentisphaerales bacterium]
MFRKCMWLTAAVLVSLAFAGPAHGQSVKINFQLGTAVTPEGYLPDSGLAYGDRGNGWTYGWSRDITADARERNNVASPDKRWDTLVHLEKGADAVWEIAIENGEYNLYIVAGDPDNTDQTNTFDVEGVIITDTNGQVGNFDEFTLTVTVADGRLTLQPAAGSSNSKICFIDIILAIAPEAARSPSPAKEAADVPRDVVMSWVPGEGVSGHDVYFGTDLDAVSNASRANPMGVLVSQDQAAATFDPTGLLEFVTTYYWRIDEVLTAGGVFKGDVWSFTTEPFAYAVQNIIATASSSGESAGPENTINGSGLNEADGHSIESTDMWLTASDAEQPAWIQYEFDRVYKMYQLLVWNYNVQFEPVLGFGAKDVTVEYSSNGEEWTALGDVEFAEAAAAENYAANTTVDMAGVPAKYVRLTINDNWGMLTQIGLSEVRFLYIPAHPREPQPAAGAADVTVDSILSWRAGRDATSHDVYFGTNQEELPLAGSPAQAAFTPSTLEFGMTYYWKVDEVADDGVWAGELWSFSTQEYALVDG